MNTNSQRDCLDETNRFQRNTTTALFRIRKHFAKAVRSAQNGLAKKKEPYRTYAQYTAQVFKTLRSACLSIRSIGDILFRLIVLQQTVGHPLGRTSCFTPTITFPILRLQWLM